MQSIIGTTRKILCAGLRIGAMAILAGCSVFDHTPQIPYVPPVTFTGMINDSLIELRGHQLQPNVCVLSHDTVKMFMCSRDYSPDPIPTGCYLRLYVMPLPPDTPAQNILSVRNIILHCELAFNGMNQSYQVIPGDSLRFDVSARLEIGSLERAHEGSITLNHIEINGLPVPGSNAPEDLVIREGTIEGSIQ